LEYSDSKNDNEDLIPLSLRFLQSSHDKDVVPPSLVSILLRCSYSNTKLSKLEVANKWLNRGLKFPDKLPLPDDLHQLCIAATTMLSNILAHLLPPDNMPVADFIKFRLPEIGKWPFSDKIMFQEDLSRGKLLIPFDHQYLLSHMLKSFVRISVKRYLMGGSPCAILALLMTDYLCG
jgi:hypothetical protein